MRLWPGGKAEHRSADYSADVVNALLASAQGGGAPPIVSALAAVEICTGLWGRAFASATVTPTDRRTLALTPSTLESMGRELATRGEAVYALDVDDNGQVRLTPAARWEVRGGIDPESWRYDLEHETPGGARKRNLPSAGVIHLRYATRPNKPWAGVSPLGMASETRALAGWIERRLAEEASTSTGYVLPIPDGGKFPMAGLKNLLKCAKGREAGAD